MNNNLLSVICFSNIFSMSATCSLPSFMVSLSVQKILIDEVKSFSIFTCGFCVLHFASSFFTPKL